MPIVPAFFFPICDFPLPIREKIQKEARTRTLLIAILPFHGLSPSHPCAMRFRLGPAPRRVVPNMIEADVPIQLRMSGLHGYHESSTDMNLLLTEPSQVSPRGDKQISHGWHVRVCCS